MAVADREILTRQIREAVDIVDLVGSYVTLRRAGANFKASCPFHQEKTPSLIIWPSTQTFKCFGCGAGGDLFTFVQLKENVDFLEARRILADRAGISLEQETAGPRSGPSKADLARANAWAQRVFRHHYQGEDGQAARDYVAGRGISDEMVEAFGIGLAVDSFDSLIRKADTSKVDLKLLLAAGLVKERQQGGCYDTFRHRLMFPIVDATGRVLGFGGRTLGDDPAKYLNTPATPLFDKSVQLFGLDRARQAMGEKGRAVVVEGYTDCIMAHQHGFTETVATLGTAMTEGHANLLRRYTDRVILLFDSDEAGQRAADRALSVALNVGLEVYLARVPEGKDPCDYLLSAGAESFEGVLNKALGALEFKWQQVAREYEASATGPGRRRAIDAYLKELAGWIGGGAIDQIQMGLLLNQLSRVLALPAEDLHRQLRGMIRRSGGRSQSAAASDTSYADTETTPVSARQESLRQIVEVLLNEPALFPRVAEHLNVEAIRDRALAAVAAELINLLAAGQTLRLDEFIGRFESTSFARLIIDLQARGEQRGHYDSVVEGAIGCLQSYEQSREAAALAEEIRRGRLVAVKTSEEHGNPAAVPTGEDEKLLALMARARNAHFASTRARKRFLDS